MSQKFEKLKTLLMELFQLDKPDLDFGIYRVMHPKSAEVMQFLDRDLLPQVNAAFGQYKTADKAEIESELAKVIAGIEAAGMDPAQSPKVADLRARLVNDAIDIGALESEVYDHLFNFFRRYYDQGDFLAKRVYKPGVYAIPYEGEEVTLHWANKDQYYIKTSEYLSDYAFRLRPDDDQQPMRVHFRLADAVEGEHGNVKAAEGQSRVFILAAPGVSGRDFMTEEDGEQGKELAIRFQYRPATLTDWPEYERDGKKKPPSQKELSALAAKCVLSVDDDSLAPWIAALGTPHLTAGGEKADYTRVEAHLRRYTARNTFDYFIHKDLGTFLRRELDFYIKNEVMHLDDVENETVPRVEQYLSKIKVIRKIAGKIIAFLAQLEDYQKKLWLKKKFVVETSWCIKLGVIPWEFYPEIAANEAQREEWVDLCSIDVITGSEGTLLEPGVPGYSQPLTSDFLKGHPTLLVDTRHFLGDFPIRLLASFNHEVNDRMSDCDCVLFHGDNFSALSLVHETLRDQVHCAPNDPPYNRLGDSFPYKDNYRHSSWLTFMTDRLQLLRPLLRPEGAAFVNIDENERQGLSAVLDLVFGQENRVEELIWAQNTTHSQSPLYSTNHEYIEVYARHRPAAEGAPDMFQEPKPGEKEITALAGELNACNASIADVEDAIKSLFREHVSSFKEELAEQGLPYDKETKTLDPWRGIYNYRHAEYRNAKGVILSEEEAQAGESRLIIWREDNASAPAQKQAASIRDPTDENFRFYRPRHPITGKPCPHPKTGWRWPFQCRDTSRDSFQELDIVGRIVWGNDHTKIPQYKRFLSDVERNVSKSFFHDYSDAEKELAALFGRAGVFPTPKPTTLVRRFVAQAAPRKGLILDIFAGSGTTGHAVINLNREDGGKRKFILVEVGDHFDTVLLPRLKKVTFSPEWKDGKPKRFATPEEAERSPRIVKVVRLESYEDALNNLETRRTKEQQGILDLAQTYGTEGLKEQYILRYMLDVETRGSQSLLNVQAFTDPTAYKLKVKRPGSDESREVNVDLLETFNWLIALTVRTIAAPQTFVAAFERDSEQRLRLKGRLKQEAEGPFWFRTVTGTTPDGRRTLIIWRKLNGEPEQDNLVLDEWFTKQGYSAKDSEFDLIYVNGGNNLENLKTADDLWKVRLIEEDFHRLMFEAEGA